MGLGIGVGVGLRRSSYLIPWRDVDAAVGVAAAVADSVCTGTRSFACFATHVALCSWIPLLPGVAVCFATQVGLCFFTWFGLGLGLGLGFGFGFGLGLGLGLELELGFGLGLGLG